MNTAHTEVAEAVGEYLMPCRNRGYRGGIRSIVISSRMMTIVKIMTIMILMFPTILTGRMVTLIRIAINFIKENVSVAVGFDTLI